MPRSPSDVMMIELSLRDAVFDKLGLEGGSGIESYSTGDADNYRSELTRSVSVCMNDRGWCGYEEEGARCTL